MERPARAGTSIPHDGFPIAAMRNRLPFSRLIPLVALLSLILSDHAPVTWLSWSPDGGQIAYIASEKGSASLWVMDADGSQPVRIVEGVFGFTDPHPDTLRPGRYPSRSA